MTDTIVNVTASNAQDVLDGKYGDITGKTINFTEDITYVLELARPTKYQGSMTTYYQHHPSLPGPAEEPVPWSEDISTIITNGAFYYRTLKDVTFTADAGVSVAGFHFVAGYMYSQGAYDYVRDKALTTGES
jgi:hypothetical protein